MGLQRLVGGVVQRAIVQADRRQHRAHPVEMDRLARVAGRAQGQRPAALVVVGGGRARPQAGLQQARQLQGLEGGAGVEHRVGVAGRDRHGAVGVDHDEVADVHRLHHATPGDVDQGLGGLLAGGHGPRG